MPTVDELLASDKARPIRTEKALTKDLLRQVRAGGGGISQAKQDFYSAQQAEAAGRQAQAVAQDIGAIGAPGRQDAQGVALARQLSKDATNAGASARRDAFLASEDTRRNTEGIAMQKSAQAAARRADTINQWGEIAATVAAAALTGGTSLAAQGLSKAASRAISAAGAGVGGTTGADIAAMEAAVAAAQAAIGG